MKNFIKIIIALIFILGAFFIGKYKCEEKQKITIKELNQKVLHLENQISICENDIQNLKVINATYKDSLEKIIEKQGITKAIRNMGFSGKLKDNAKDEH